MLERLYARLEALVLAGADMYDVYETARYLLDEHPESPGHGAKMPWHVRRTLESGLFVTYARPFIQTRSQPSMKRATGITEEQRKSHEDIVRRRHLVYAHTDRTALRRIIELSDPKERANWVREQGELREEWFPPTAEGLRELITLAQAHLASFLSEIDRVRKRILELA